jgi:benzoylformate decarboxylase
MDHVLQHQQAYILDMRTAQNPPPPPKTDDDTGKQASQTRAPAQPALNLFHQQGQLLAAAAPGDNQNIPVIF